MSDVQTNDNAPPAPAEAPPDVVHKHIDAPITGGSEESRIRESVRELNKKREREGTLVEEPAEPVKLRYYKSDEPETYKGAARKSLREASKAVSDYHRLEKPDAQFVIKQGMSPRDVLDLAKNEEWTRNVTGWSHEEVAGYARTGEPPPTKIGLIDDRKGLKAPLRDHDQIFTTPTKDGISADEVFKNPRDAAREVSNFREVLRQEQERLRAEVEGAGKSKRKPQKRRVSRQSNAPHKKSTTASKRRLRHNSSNNNRRRSKPSAFVSRIWNGRRRQRTKSAP
jgi:hypothetical protein